MWVVGMRIDRRHYSIIPIRAVQLVRKGETWRVLAALGHYASVNGICYPAQTTLGEMAGGMSQPHVSRALKELHQLGLVRLLMPVGRKPRKSFQKQNRYQVLYLPDQPLPSAKEVEIGWGARSNRW